MTSNQFINWIKKTESCDIGIHKIFALQILFASMKYLLDMGFQSNDFQKVFDEYNKSDLTGMAPRNRTYRRYKNKGAQARGDSVKR